MADMEWMPIESAPKDGTYVLIADDSHVTVGKYHEDKGEHLVAAEQPYWEPYDWSYWDRWQTDDSWFLPTHWMPLPAPPALAAPSSTEIP